MCQLQADELFDETFESWKLTNAEWEEHVITEIADFAKQFAEQMLLEDGEDAEDSGDVVEDDV